MVPKIVQIDVDFLRYGHLNAVVSLDFASSCTTCTTSSDMTDNIELLILSLGGATCVINLFNIVKRHVQNDRI